MTGPCQMTCPVILRYSSTTETQDTLSDDDIAALSRYVIDGGGLITVGGEHSYERGQYHQTPALEAILPVQSVEEPEKKRREMAVVILMDISQSTAYGLQSDSKIAVEKALALNILKQLDFRDYVGVGCIQRRGI